MLGTNGLKTSQMVLLLRLVWISAKRTDGRREIDGRTERDGTDGWKQKRETDGRMDKKGGGADNREGGANEQGGGNGRTKREGG